MRYISCRACAIIEYPCIIMPPSRRSALSITQCFFPSQAFFDLHFDDSDTFYDKLPGYRLADDKNLEL